MSVDLSPPFIFALRLVTCSAEGALRNLVLCSLSREGAPQRRPWKPRAAALLSQARIAGWRQSGLPSDSLLLLRFWNILNWGGDP